MIDVYLYQVINHEDSFVFHIKELDKWIECDPYRFSSFEGELYVTIFNAETVFNDKRLLTKLGKF